MFEKINTWQELRNEIEELFAKSLFVKNNDKVHKDMLSIVNEIEKKQEFFLESPKSLSEYLFKNYNETLDYWLPYLTGMVAKLLIVDYVDGNNDLVDQDEVVDAYKSNDKKRMQNIFIVLTLDKERIKELNKNE